MTMQSFSRVAGPAAALPGDNIDTDLIIRIERLAHGPREELGRYAFEALRHLPDGGENPAFPFNQPMFRVAPILIAGANFGCGSSREGAVWALMGLGLRCVIAPSFGDIFFENAFKNGLLPVILPEHEVRALLDYLAATNDPTLSVDLKRCVVETPQGEEVLDDVEAGVHLDLGDGCLGVGLGAVWAWSGDGVGVAAGGFMTETVVGRWPCVWSAATAMQASGE